MHAEGCLLLAASIQRKVGLCICGESYNNEHQIHEWLFPWWFLYGFRMPHRDYALYYDKAYKVWVVSKYVNSQVSTPFCMVTQSQAITPVLIRKEWIIVSANSAKAKVQISCHHRCQYSQGKVNNTENDTRTLLIVFLEWLYWRFPHYKNPHTFLEADHSP